MKQIKFLKHFKLHIVIPTSQETVIDRFNSFDHLSTLPREPTFGYRDLLACLLYLILYIKRFYEMV